MQITSNLKISSEIKKKVVLTQLVLSPKACLNLFIWIITTIVVFVLENFDDDELKLIGSILKDVFLIFPQYCLGRGLLEMAIEYNSNLVASQFGKQYAMVSVQSLAVNVTT